MSNVTDGAKVVIKKDITEYSDILKRNITKELIKNTKKKSKKAKKINEMLIKKSLLQMVANKGVGVGLKQEATTAILASKKKKLISYKDIPSWMGEEETEELIIWRKENPKMEDPIWSKTKILYDTYWGEKILSEYDDIMKSRLGFDINPPEYGEPDKSVKTWELYYVTYHTYKPYGKSDLIHEEHEVKMNKVTFKHLNLVVYSIDGVFFNRKSYSIILREHEWLRDPTNLMKQDKEKFERCGGGVTCNLRLVAKMDKEQGTRIFAKKFNAEFNLVFDLASIIVPILKPMAAVKRFFKITSYANATRNVVISLHEEKLQDVTKTSLATIFGNEECEILNKIGSVSGVIFDFQSLVEAFSETGYKAELFD